VLPILVPFACTHQDIPRLACGMRNSANGSTSGKKKSCGAALGGYHLRRLS
jgi:hypothetical protein